ncbi:MAG TPA: hypothetical protein VND24_04740, partial [Steroidobacteraceae bacterium]|nr:hypothetical protein [Steroidobacteraceae bacterium]
RWIILFLFVAVVAFLSIPSSLCPLPAALRPSTAVVTQRQGNMLNRRRYAWQEIFKSNVFSAAYDIILNLILVSARAAE